MTVTVAESLAPSPAVPERSGVVSVVAEPSAGAVSVTVGADVSTGTRLPQLFAQAGVGTPDGTDVAGRIEPLATGRIIMEGAFRSVLPTALAHGVTTEARATAALASIDRDATRFPDRPVLWPLLIGAWKRKGQA